eukprot:Tbor_TRINITY_DN4345_c0_g1::TRINITY_DN4345_c0_g1_i1::g.7681::m.7681
MPPTTKAGEQNAQSQEPKSIAASSTTMQKASASKAFLENHYRGMLRGLKQQEDICTLSPTVPTRSELGGGCGNDGRSDMTGDISVLGARGGGARHQGTGVNSPTHSNNATDGQGVPFAGGTVSANVVRRREREIRPSDFTLLKCIGRGAFGDVYICSKNSTTCDASLDNNSSVMDGPSGKRNYNVTQNGKRLYAMKRMRKADMLKKKQVLHVRSERNVLAEAAQVNPYVVQLYYSFQDDSYLYMVTEYAPGGDLMSWLISEQIFTVEQTRFYIAELCMAIKSVHEMNYVHRDIKPDNILIDIRGHAKLSDFGLCKKFELPSKKERQRWLEMHKMKATSRAEKALQQGIAEGLLPDDYTPPVHSPVNIKGDIYTDVDGSDDGLDSDDEDAIHIPKGKSGARDFTSGHTRGLMNTCGYDDDNVVDLYEELEDDDAHGKHLTSCNIVKATFADAGQGRFMSPVPSGMPSQRMTESRRFDADSALDNSSNTNTSTLTSLSGTGTDAHAKSTLKEVIKRHQRFDSIVGSPGYIAPEILLKQPYGINCDYWSVGVIMYEMLYGGPPFYAADPQTTCSKIVNWRTTLKFPKPDGKKIPYVPPEAIDLMVNLLCDMDSRYDFNQIKVHPFFNGVDWDNLQAIEPVEDMENHRKNSVSARGSQGLCVTGGGRNGVMVPFFPKLSHPLDTRYFPDMDNRQRLVDEQHVQLMKAEDPRGVIFADFKFKRDE